MKRFLQILLLSIVDIILTFLVFNLTLIAFGMGGMYYIGLCFLLGVETINLIIFIIATFVGMLLLATDIVGQLFQFDLKIAKTIDKLKEI